MRVLSIGTDRKLFEEESAVFVRQMAYAKALGTMDIIVFTLSGHTKVTHGIESGSLNIVPTRSRSRLLYGWDAIRIARRLERPNVVSVQDPFETGLVGLLVALMLHVPLHVQVHTDFLSPAFSTLAFLNRIRGVIAGFVLHRASRTRVVSERIKRGIEKRYRLHTPITILPIFVDVERFRQVLGDPALSERFSRFKTKLLVVARLEPEKNITLAVCAFAHYAPQDSCLIILGTGSQRHTLEALACKSNVVDRIFFEGGNTPAPYYRLADLVLFPSYYDGYGMVIVEALAAGKPVLSTDVGIAREAGAIIASEETFGEALAEWFTNGPRIGVLKSYPYRDSDEYIKAYCKDIIATV